MLISSELFLLGGKFSWLNLEKKKHDRTKPQEQLFWGKEASSVESFYYDLTGLDAMEPHDLMVLWYPKFAFSQGLVSN